MIVDAVSLKTRYLSSIHPDKLSLGTVFYPISIFILTILLWEIHRLILIFATLVMVVPDALAAIVGEKYGRNYFTAFREKKSFAGSSAMFLSTFLIILMP